MNKNISDDACLPHIDDFESTSTISHSTATTITQTDSDINDIDAVGDVLSVEPDKDSTQEPKLNFSKLQAAFCLSSIAWNKDLMEAQEHIKKEKDDGKVLVRN